VPRPVPQNGRWRSANPIKQSTRTLHQSPAPAFFFVVCGEEYLALAPLPGGCGSMAHLEWFASGGMSGVQLEFGRGEAAECG
jgi:hypothetical protein